MELVWLKWGQIPGVAPGSLLPTPYLPQWLNLGISLKTIELEQEAQLFPSPPEIQFRGN